MLTLKLISNRTEGKDYKLIVDGKEGESIEERRERSGVMGKALREMGREIVSYVRKTSKGGKKSIRRSKKEINKRNR